VPRPLARLLTAFDTHLARDLGWAQLRDGKLLQSAEGNDFQVILKGDKTLPDENEISGRKIGLVAMSDNHWPIIRDYVPAISEALNKCKPGQVLSVFCGEFKPRNPKKQRHKGR
jgi:hypothetical protein